MTNDTQGKWLLLGLLVILLGVVALIARQVSQDGFEPEGPVLVSPPPPTPEERMLKALQSIQASQEKAGEDVAGFRDDLQEQLGDIEASQAAIADRQSKLEKSQPKLEEVLEGIDGLRKRQEKIEAGPMPPSPPSVQDLQPPQGEKTAEGPVKVEQ